MFKSFLRRFVKLYMHIKVLEFITKGNKVGSPITFGRYIDYFVFSTTNI